jgi:hypothetical protein
MMFGMKKSSKLGGLKFTVFAFCSILVDKLLGDNCGAFLQGVSAVRLFPLSGHLLLSCSMDCKIKVSFQ